MKKNMVAKPILPELKNTALKNIPSHVCWCLPKIPVHERVRQEDHKFEASLGYTDKLCLKNNNNNKKKKQSILQTIYFVQILSIHEYIIIY
jgi:hypothetical protein